MSEDKKNDSAADSESKQKKQPEEFDDADLLEKEFVAPEEHECWEQDEDASSRPDRPNLEDLDLAAIFENEEGYEFVDWPVEGFLENGKEERKIAPTAGDNQLSDENANALDSIEMARKSAGIRSSEGIKIAEQHANAPSEGFLAGSARDANSNGENISSGEGRAAETKKGKRNWKVALRSIAGNRFKLLVAACAFLLVLFASQAEKLAGISLWPDDFDMLFAGKVDAERTGSVLEDLNGRHPDGSKFDSDQPNLLAPKRALSNPKMADGKRSTTGILQFETDRDPVRMNTIDAQETAEWESMLFAGNQLESRFRALWDETEIEVRADRKIQESRSPEWNHLANAIILHPGGSAGEIDSAIGISADFDRAAEREIAGAAENLPASAVNDPAESDLFSTASKMALALAEDVVIDSETSGIDSVSVSKLDELEARLSSVEGNRNDGERIEKEVSVVGNAVRSVAEDLKAYRTEMDSIIHSIGQQPKSEVSSSKLQHTVDRLEKRVANLSIDMVALAELAVTGRSAERLPAANAREAKSNGMPNPSSEGGLVYDHYPVRFLSGSFDPEADRGFSSWKPAAENPSFGISSETPEYGIGSEMLAPGDYLASFGTILETVKDKNGGLLIVASHGAFYIEPD